MTVTYDKTTKCFLDILVQLILGGISTFINHKYCSYFLVYMGWPFQGNYDIIQVNIMSDSTIIIKKQDNSILVMYMIEYHLE